MVSSEFEFSRAEWKVKEFNENAQQDKMKRNKHEDYTTASKSIRQAAFSGRKEKLTVKMAERYLYVKKWWKGNHRTKQNRTISKVLKNPVCV